MAPGKKTNIDKKSLINIQEMYCRSEKELEESIDLYSIKGCDKDVYYIYIALPYYINQLTDLDDKNSIKCLQLYIKSFKPTIDHLLNNKFFNIILSIFFATVKLRNEDLLEKLSYIESRNIHKLKVEM